ncbi:MAG: prepilin-type N-terminal cleavage/methylation domain-containing protein [Phycisphaerales bacterium]|nr:prepilin-type N-terminal cleavage/methylation domain-containing protein [Phycisphaerales bacterium]
MSSARTNPRGFSLIELLMAIFILGIGLISIASLLPVGVTLQQRAEDELMGPMVAADALDFLRSKLEPNDFGSWWDYFEAQQDYYTEVLGDFDTADGLEQATYGKLYSAMEVQPAAWTARDVWPWQRPAVLTDVPSEDLKVEPGTIDVFNALAYEGVGESVGEHRLADGHPWLRFQSFQINDTDQSPIGIPFNLSDRPAENAILSIPHVLITPEERSWPRPDVTGRRPSYFWECAFRRVGEEVQVAIFVYRVQATSLNQPVWKPQAVRSADAPDELVPLLHMVNLANPELDCGMWTVGMQGAEDADRIPGGWSGDSLNLMHPDWSWQKDGQYLLDLYGTMHRVQAGRRESSDALMLTAPVPAPVVATQADRLDKDEDGATDDPLLYSASTLLPPYAMRYMTRSEHYPTGLVEEGTEVVDRLWYLPSDVTATNGSTYRIVPIYATVGNL